MTKEERILRAILKNKGRCADVAVVCTDCPMDNVKGCQFQCDQDIVEVEAKKLLDKIVEKKALDRVIQKMLERVRP